MNNKRKNRTVSVRSPRMASSRNVAVEGVYKNWHFMRAIASHVGDMVQVHTQSGSIWEGVFRTFSPLFEIVIEMAHRVDREGTTIHMESLTEKMIFKPEDIVSIKARDADLEYATRDSFQTDAAISKYNGRGGSYEERPLQPWEGLDGSPVNGDVLGDIDLEQLDNRSNGWDANDMFRKNEMVYGVQSTFDHSLAGYTVPLQKKDTRDYREAEQKAKEIAAEIENQPAYKQRIELENGDEEDKFAAVHRPASSGPQHSRDVSGARDRHHSQRPSPPPSNGTDPQPGDKYVPPNKRKHPQVGKLVMKSTPPQSQSGGPPPSGNLPSNGNNNSVSSTPPSSASSNSGSANSSSGNNNTNCAGTPPSAPPSVPPPQVKGPPPSHVGMQYPPLPIHHQTPPHQVHVMNMGGVAAGGKSYAAAGASAPPSQQPQPPPHAYNSPPPFTQHHVVRNVGGVKNPEAPMVGASNNNKLPPLQQRVPRHMPHATPPAPFPQAHHQHAQDSQPSSMPPVMSHPVVDGRMPSPGTVGPSPHQGGVPPQHQRPRRQDDTVQNLRKFSHDFKLPPESVNNNNGQQQQQVQQHICEQQIIENNKMMGGKPPVMVQVSPQQQQQQQQVVVQHQHQHMAQHHQQLQKQQQQLAQQQQMVHQQIAQQQQQHILENGGAQSAQQQQQQQVQMQLQQHTQQMEHQQQQQQQQMHQQQQQQQRQQVEHNKGRAGSPQEIKQDHNKVQNSNPEVCSSPPQQVGSQHPTPSTTPSAPAPPTTTTGAPPPAPSTPSTTDSTTASMEKVTTAVKKSTLNPNAKEFNPSVKSFVARSPSTPNPSRSATPVGQIPNQYMGGVHPGAQMVMGAHPHHHATATMAMVGVQGGAAGAGGQPPQPQVVGAAPPPGAYAAAPVAPMHHQHHTGAPAPHQYHTPPQPHPGPPHHARFRKMPMGQMQVAAATGQPLLAPAPLPQYTAVPYAHSPHQAPPQYPMIGINPYGAYWGPTQMRVLHHEGGMQQLQYLGAPPPPSTPSPQQQQQQQQPPQQAPPQVQQQPPQPPAPSYHPSSSPAVPAQPNPPQQQQPPQYTPQFQLLCLPPGQTHHLHYLPPQAQQPHQPHLPVLLPPQATGQPGPQHP